MTATSPPYRRRDAAQSEIRFCAFGEEADGEDGEDEGAAMGHVWLGLGLSKRGYHGYGLGYMGRSWNLREPGYV